MAGNVTFNVGAVRRLFEHSRAALEHGPSYEHLFDAQYHKSGVILCDDGTPYKDESGQWPDSNNIDTKLVPACIVLVGDQGIYLMSNGMPALLAEEGKTRNVIAYAKESDPTDETNEDWYDAKVDIFGGDDGTIPLPLSMFVEAMKLPDSATLKVNITSRHVTVVVPAKQVKLAKGMKLKFEKPFNLKGVKQSSLFIIENVPGNILMALDEDGKPLHRCKISDIRKYVRSGNAKIVKDEPEAKPSVSSNMKPR